MLNMDGTKVFGAFLDSSKAFDSFAQWIVLFKKPLDREVPVSFVLLFKYWYSRLCCAVKRDNVIGAWFPILCGVRQDKVLSPYLYAICVDDVINELRCSGYGIHISSMFVGCLFYADDIVLFTPSCHGLQRLVNICEWFDVTWDIKFNPAESQLITFGGKNPQNSRLHLNNQAVSWADKKISRYFHSI